MEKKSLFVIMLTAVLCTSFLVPSALAGGRPRHSRWGGVAIGIGVVMPGIAFYFRDRHYSHRNPDHYRSFVPRYAYPGHRRYRGHRKVRKERIPLNYKKVWNPGHYNSHGK